MRVTLYKLIYIAVDKTAWGGQDEVAWPPKRVGRAQEHSSNYEGIPSTLQCWTRLRGHWAFEHIWAPRKPGSGNLSLGSKGWWSKTWTSLSLWSSLFNPKALKPQTGNFKGNVKHKHSYLFFPQFLSSHTDTLTHALGVLPVILSLKIPMSWICIPTLLSFKSQH